MAWINYPYGLSAQHELTPLALELHCYRTGRKPEQQGLGRAQHFKNICAILWGPKSLSPFEWHPWNERMNEVSHVHPVTGQEYPHFSLSGCASSSKSHWLAAYAIINWLCDPYNTFVYITSTSTAGAKHRVWKSIMTLYWASPVLQAIGKMVDSQAKICTIHEGTGKHDDSAGIFILAAAPSKARESIGQIIGRKNKRVFLLADELAELSFAVLEAAFGNLMANPLFQFGAASNFKSREDAFGEVTEPKDGWDSINIESDEWETKRGYCLRFDGMRSPNILAGKDIYPYIYGSKQLKEHRTHGEKSITFWRMCRSFETPAGLENAIYSESDLASGKAYDQNVIWDYSYVNLGGADPSYTTGGDRFMFWHGRLGKSNGLWVLLLIKSKVLREDVTKLNERTRDYQMADQLKMECESSGIAPENFGLDITASSFGSILAELWSPKFHRVNFGGAPTDRAVFGDDPRRANQLYTNRVSEIWYVGKEFMRFGQIRGVTTSLGRELKARIYDSIKGATGLRIRVEPKTEMKKRLGFSPDEADACFVLLDTARERLQFLAGGLNQGVRKSTTSFLAKSRKADTVYHEMYAEELQV